MREVLPRQPGAVIGGVIYEDHRVLLPTGPLHVQLRAKLLHEQAEGVVVSGGVGHRQVRLTLSVNGSDDGDARPDQLVSDGVRLPTLTPLHVSHVSVDDPCLIHVEKSGVPLQLV